MMKQMKDLTYSDFIDLITYLASLSKEETDEETLLFVQDRLSGFFPKLDAVQEMELFHICKTKDQVAFEHFKAQYSDIQIDETGQSIPEPKVYWKLREESLNNIFMFALEDLKKNNFIDKTEGKINTQVFNAKKLSALKNMDKLKDSVYIYKRKLFIDKHNLSYKMFNKAERDLSKAGVSDVSLFFMNVLEFCKDKKPEEFELFLEHLFERIEILCLDKDLVSESSKQLLEDINSIINKNK